MDLVAHWQNLYAARHEQDVSWFQDSPEPSLSIIASVAAANSSAILDVGGGAARLVDALVGQGYADVSVLDLSEKALDKSRARLGAAAAARVKWIVADITTWEPTRQFDIWHDRAAFHFLTSPTQQAAYANRLHRALGSGAHAIIATFAPDGPEKCSGLPVIRHDAKSLSDIFGADFSLQGTQLHEHATPWGAKQRFQFSVFKHA